MHFRLRHDVGKLLQPAGNFDQSRTSYLQNGKRILFLLESTR